MSLETGMVSSKEQKHMLFFTAEHQCDQTWITSEGSMVPLGAIPDHVRIDDLLPIFFPGTYDYNTQGGKDYGLFPPRSEEQPSDLQSHMRISYAVFCLKKKKLHVQK